MEAKNAQTKDDMKRKLRALLKTKKQKLTVAELWQAVLKLNDNELDALDRFMDETEAAKRRIREYN